MPTVTWPRFFGIFRRTKDAQVKNTDAAPPSGNKQSSRDVNVLSALSQETAQIRNKLSHSKSRTLIRVISTTLRPQSAANGDAPPPPNFASRANREAALRERGLIPPQALNKDSGSENGAQYSVPSTLPIRETVGVKRGIRKQISAAMLIKQEWEAKNAATRQTPDDTPPSRLAGREEPQSPLSKFDFISPARLLRGKRSLPLFAHGNNNTSTRIQRHGLPSANLEMTSVTAPVTRTSMQQSLSLNASPTDLDGKHPHDRALSPPSGEARSYDVFRPNRNPQRVSSRMKIGSAKPQARLDEFTAIAESPNECAYAEGSTPVPQTSMVRPVASEDKGPEEGTQQFIDSLKSHRMRRRSFTEASFKCSGQGGLSKRLPSSISVGDLRQRHPRMCADNEKRNELWHQPSAEQGDIANPANEPGMKVATVGTRKAVSPLLYNRESILLEINAIEDEESRRITQLAFLG